MRTKEPVTKEVKNVTGSIIKKDTIWQSENDNSIIAYVYKIVKLSLTSTQPPFIFFGFNLPGIFNPWQKSFGVRF